jgi:hypothetical protein
VSPSRDRRRPNHLPHLRSDGEPPHPSWLPRQRAGTTPQMIGRYPDYDVLANAENWDAATRAVVLRRVGDSPRMRFFTASEQPTLRALCDVATAQDAEPRVPVAEMVDEKLAAGRLDGFRYADMPPDPDTWRLVLRGVDESARAWSGAESFAACHYAGYCPRFHPSDFETFSRDGVGVDWPISYADLKPHFQLVERELPVAGQDWPWGDPHRYPFSPHPVSGSAERLWKGAIAQGIEMRAGPVGIVSGTFGNRPHCIYRWFC